MEFDDRQLVRRCQQGDREAFRLLVERYQRKVYRLAFGMVQNPDDAMDIVQEAFIKVHRYIDNFQGNSSFQTWLYRIASNICIDHLRRGGRRPAVEYDDEIRHESDDDGSDVMTQTRTESPERTLGRKELNGKILEAIESLSKKHRQVILLREIEGLSYEEISEALQINKGTVMSRLHHARLQLKKKLQSYLSN